MEPDVCGLFDDVGVKRYVRLASEICDIDQSSSTVDQHAERLFQDVTDQLHVLLVRQIVVVILANVVRRRGDHEVNGTVGKFGHFLAGMSNERVEEFGWH